MAPIDKREIQKRIEELRNKINHGEEINISQKETKISANKIKMAEKNFDEFFYVFDGKTLLIAIIVALLLIFSAYYLQLKTPIFDQLFSLTTQHFF